MNFKDLEYNKEYLVEVIKNKQQGYYPERTPFLLVPRNNHCIIETLTYNKAFKETKEPYWPELRVITDDSIIKKWKQTKEKINAYRLNSKLKFTLGTDPEVFAFDKDNNLIPAFNFLQSKQENKSVFWDGFQAEFMVNTSMCLSYLSDNIRTGLLKTSSLLKKYDKNAKLKLKTEVEIPKQLLLDSKDEYVAFGCMPSLNAYDMAGMKLDGREVDFRSSGGHIHLDITNVDTNQNLRPEQIKEAVKVIDMIAGVCSVSLFEKFDSARRRMMYGLAGEYRLPSYGLEYRVFSNAWLAHPLVANLVFDLTRQSVRAWDCGLYKQIKQTEKEVIEIINTCDVEAARKYMKRNKSVLMLIFDSIYIDRVKSAMVFKMWYRGMHTFVDNAEDIEGNWKLNGSWTAHGNLDDILGSFEQLLFGRKVS